MWYKNKKNRIEYIKSIPAAKVTLDQIKESYYTYFAVFEKQNSKYVYTCTKCGNQETFKKRRYAHRCSKCEMIFDYEHIKNKRFKNYFDKFNLKVLNNQDLILYDFLYIEVTYDPIQKLLVFSKPEVIVRQFSCKEKKNIYVHNYAYGHQNSYNFYYKHDKKPTEQTGYQFNGDYIYITEDDKTNYLQYIDLTNKDLKEIRAYEFKKDTYTFELLQKYNSLYLLHHTKKEKDKVVDMLGLRKHLTKHQAVQLLQLHSKEKSLDLQIYKDYLSMCRTIKKGLTEEDIFNLDYKRLHDEYSLQIEVANAKEKSKKLRELSRLYPDKKIQDYYVIHPKSVEDILEEADQLKHCVKTYVNKVAKGITQIFFVRKERDKPLITCEVKDGYIQQFYGYKNTTDIEGYSKAKFEMQTYINEVILH